MRDCRRQIAKKAYMPVIEIKCACSEAVKNRMCKEVWHYVNSQILASVPLKCYAIHSRFIQY